MRPNVVDNAKQNVGVPYFPFRVMGFGSSGNQSLQGILSIGFMSATHPSV